MNRNLYTKELKRNRKNLLIWSGIVVGFTFMIVSLFPYMQGMGAELGTLMESMPEEMSKAFGMEADSWSNIMGFYKTYYGVYIIVLMAIYTGSTGAQILSKEERERTAEFLLTQPISRSEIVWSKIASLYTLSGFIFLAQIIVAALGMAVFSDKAIDWSDFLIVHIHGLFLVIFFTAIGVLISMFGTPKKNFMGPVVGVVFGCYILNALSMATSSVDWLGYLTPFHYMRFDVTAADFGFEWLSAIILTGISFGILWFCNRIYAGKDVNA